MSEYVQAGSELDGEARQRGCTIYLPDRAIPMLPAALAADLCSLLPEQERFTLAVIADLDSEAVVERYEIVEGVMRSRAMLTYGGVARALGFSEAPPKSAQAGAFKRDLKVLDELARKLRKRRMGRGALDWTCRRPREGGSKTGAPVDVVRRAEDPGVKRAYAMVEEMMLLGNEIVARFMGGEEIARRVPRARQARPDQARAPRARGAQAGRRVRRGAPRRAGRRGALARAKVKQAPAQERARDVAPALAQAGDLRHLEHRPLRARLGSVPALHLAHPALPGSGRSPRGKGHLRGGKPATSPAAVQALTEAAAQSGQRERAAMDIEARGRRPAPRAPHARPRGVKLTRAR